MVHTDSDYSEDDNEKPLKVDLATDHPDEPNNYTPNAAAAVIEDEKPANFMSELASKLGGPQQKKKDNAIVESVRSFTFLLQLGIC